MWIWYWHKNAIVNEHRRRNEIGNESRESAIERKRTGETQKMHLPLYRLQPQEQVWVALLQVHAGLDAGWANIAMVGLGVGGGAAIAAHTVT
jgi:hypothetical protein